MSALLEVAGLDVTVGKRRLVTGLNLSIGPGERLAILGRNGAGKTSLMHTLAGLRPPAAGRILIAGEDIARLPPGHLARLRGLMPQHQHDAFAATVLETALIGRHPWLGRWTWEGPRDEALAHAALSAVDLDGLALREIHTLSGGERQRLAIATLLTQEPRLALLDEPLAHLDLNHQVAVLDLLARRARDTGLAVVMVLHDINLALAHADRALLLDGAGGHREGPVAEVMTADSLSRLFDHPLREISDGGRRYLVAG